MATHKPLWSGRFKEPLSAIALKFSSSIDVDKELFREDIAGSIAHVEMLAAVKILTAEEARRIRSGLKEVSKEIEQGKLDLSWDKEDIHMAIEQRLIQKIGILGGKLHTARSRNDQVALDERLYLRGAIVELKKLVLQLQRVLLYKSEKYFGTIMPGYTHLQRAQPIYLSHYLLSAVSMLERDYERLADCFQRVNHLPLGAAALAGTSFPINRALVAKKLDFDGIIENSLDAVSDRDYLLEFASVCAIIMNHLSRFAEDLILWSSQEFSFAVIDDAYTTGSSIMPQKKNPDMAELVRGKSGRVNGNLVSLLTMLKGLPSSYNRDMQEDKIPMFDTVQTTRESLFIFSHILVHTTFNATRFESDLKRDFLTATEIADYLVKKGSTFREAHAVTGKIVAYCIEHRLSLTEVPLTVYQQFSPKIDHNIFELLEPHKSIENKKSAGSTAPHEVKKQIIHWTRVLKNRKA